MNRFREWWTRRRKKPSKPLVAIATNSSEQLTQESTGFEAATDDEEFRRLLNMFQNTVWGREQISALLTDLFDHVYEDHAEPNDCDSWCVPDRMSVYLRQRSKNQLTILLVILMKSYLVLHVQHEQGVEDP